MDRIGSLLIDWLGCCSALESCVGHVGWLFGSLFRLVVDGIVVVLVSCLLGGLKVMNGVRLFCVFVLAEGGINLPAASVSSSPVVASSIVVSVDTARPRVRFTVMGIGPD